MFPSLVWVVLAGTLLTRTAFFMVWPFLAVILEREFALSPSQIGSILGAGFMASALLGFYAGNLSDRFGRQPIMVAGAFGAAVAFALLATADSVAAYAFGAFIVGLSRSAVEAPGTAAIADTVPSQRVRDLALHARYFLINVGGAIGPLLGLVFGLAARQPTFWLAAAMNAAYGVLVVIAFRRARESALTAGRHSVSLAGAIRILRADRQFLLLLVAMVLSLFAYAQHQSTLVQHVSTAGGDAAVVLVAALVITNAVTIVLFQFPLLKLLQRHDPYVRTYAGVGLFAAAFVLFAFLPVSGLWLWVATTWLLSVGEAVLFPTLQIQVDRLAPPDMKGSYFGAAGLSAIGFGIGPFVGGYMLEHIGGTSTFVATAAMCVICGLFYWRASRHAVAGTPGGTALPDASD
jgi:MFS family permease